MIAWWWLVVQGVLLVALGVLAIWMVHQAWRRGMTERLRLDRVAQQRCESELATCRMRYAELDHGYQQMVERYNGLVQEGP